MKKIILGIMLIVVIVSVNAEDVNCNLKIMPAYADNMLSFVLVNREQLSSASLILVADTNTEVMFEYDNNRFITEVEVEKLLSAETIYIDINNCKYVVQIQPHSALVMPGSSVSMFDVFIQDSSIWGDAEIFRIDDDVIVTNNMLLISVAIVVVFLIYQMWKRKD